MIKHIPVSEPNIGELEKLCINQAIDSSWISSKGKYIDLFESNFSKYLDCRESITTSNGTVSLHLILLALGIGFGDEVIVPTFTYIASVNAISYVGATPVFVDSEPDTWNMDVNKIEELINSKTKAIMAVHIYGHSVDMDPLLKLCNKYNLFLVEDAAEAIGTKYKRRYVGTFGIAGSFSFFGNKTITTGEGGMVVTNNETLAKLIRKLKNQGNSEEKKYWHDMIGYNYRMTNIQAAIGYAQLQRIEELVSKKRIIAKWYKKYLNNNLITHCVEKDYCESSFWMYSILLNGTVANKREKFIEILLKEYGIETRPFFYPAHILPMYKNFCDSQYPICESFYYKGLNLPSSTKLSEDDVKYIAQSIENLIIKLEREL